MAQTIFIYFNKIYSRRELVQKYAHMKMPTNNEAAKRKQTPNISHKAEITFLYKEKQQLNTRLYHTHIRNANTWQQTWSNTENQKLQQEMGKNIPKNNKNTQLKLKQQT